MYFFEAGISSKELLFRKNFFRSKYFLKTVTYLEKLVLIAWKVSKYGVFSGPYFPLSDWIRYSVRMQENTDEKKLRI